MPKLKNGVAGFKLEDSKGGNYHTYRHRQQRGDGNQLVYSVTLQNAHPDAPCEWRVSAGGHYEGSGRRPRQAQSFEQYGGPSHCADSFGDAKKKAYALMRAFSGSPGYNGLLDLAAEANWEHGLHGKYGG